MDQGKIEEKIKNTVIEMLPEEGVKELADAYESGKTDSDVKAILEKYNIDINQVAVDVIKKEQPNG